MSTPPDQEQDVVLHFPFPEEKFTTILSKLGYSANADFRKASFEQKRIVFLLAFREFLKGYFLLEEFGEVAKYLKLTFDTKTRTKSQLDYEFITYEVSDISSEVRNPKFSEKNSFNIIMKNIRRFFHDYKYLLEDISQEFPPSQYFEDSQRDNFDKDKLLLVGKDQKLTAFMVSHGFPDSDLLTVSECKKLIITVIDAFLKKEITTPEFLSFASSLWARPHSESNDVESKEIERLSFTMTELMYNSGDIIEEHFPVITNKNKGNDIIYPYDIDMNYILHYYLDHKDELD